MKDREIIILLLQIIKFNGDINHLLINVFATDYYSIFCK